jgi:hypothetical protein
MCQGTGVNRFTCTSGTPRRHERREGDKFSRAVIAAGVTGTIALRQGRPLPATPPLAYRMLDVGARTHFF